MELQCVEARRCTDVSTLLESIVPSLSSTERKAYQKRLTEATLAKVSEDGAYLQLANEVSDIVESEEAFYPVDCEDGWSDDEHATFKRGMAFYQGKARLLYASLTGFTMHFIHVATNDIITGRPKLCTAARNLKISSESVARPGEECSVPELRRRLTMFLQFGNEEFCLPSY